MANPDQNAEKYNKELLRKQREFMANRGLISKGAVGMSSLKPTKRGSDADRFNTQNSLKELAFTDSMLLSNNKNVPGA